MIHNYVSHVKQHYRKNTTVVYDVYSDSEINTRNTETQWRSAILQSTDILFEWETKVVVGQKTFLANEHKLRFINQLAEKLSSSSFSMKKATVNTDLLITQIAIHQFLNG